MLLLRSMAVDFPIWALIPAAGASRRLGQDKRRVMWRGQTLLEHTVEILSQAGFDNVMVILEPDSPCATLEGLKQVVIATNPQPELGMLSSIRTGLDALPEGALAAGIQPGDHPFIEVSAVAEVLLHFRRHEPMLLLPRFLDKRGHPLFIHHQRFEAAKSCDDAVGLRQLLNRHADELVELPLPYRGLERDLDNPEDLKKLRESGGA
jgi:molybdenum cofactor cytidylyltransferase